MLSVTPNALTTATLEGAPAGLTLTARLVDGDETLTTVVTVAPKLDADGDPLDAYTASFLVPADLPVMLEWLEDGERVGLEMVASNENDYVAYPLFATLNQLALRLGMESAASMTAAQQAQGISMLEMATALIVDTVDRDVEWAAALTVVPAVLRAVCLEAVARVMQNPSGARSQSETLGAYQYSASYTDGAHGLMLTDAEVTLCRRAIIGATSGSAYVDSLVTVISPRTSLDELVEASADDPLIYDWTD